MNRTQINSVKEAIAFLEKSGLRISRLKGVWELRDADDFYLMLDSDIELICYARSERDILDEMTS